MASIVFENAWVEIPIFGVGSNSLKSTLLRKAVGGGFAKSGAGLSVTALKDISLDLKDGDRIGVVGQNGSGKTTLLRTMSGVYPPTRGTVTVEGRISPMFDLSLGMSPDATGVENVHVCGALWGLTAKEIEDGIEDVFEFTELGDYLNVPVRTYSAGMLLRLSFAIATLRQPEILLLDEVIGVGDATFMRKAEERLQNLIHRSQVLVVSSHSDAIIRRLCNRVIWLNQGVMEMFDEVEPVLAAYNEAAGRAETAEDLDDGASAALDPTAYRAATGS